MLRARDDTWGALRGCVIAASAAVLALAAPTLAQDPPPPRTGPPSFTPTDEIEPIAMMIGEMHGLRYVCAGDSDQSWRDFMIQLLTKEASTAGPRRERLINAFNLGYTRQFVAGRSCDAEVRTTEARLAAEGRRLAQELADRYLTPPDEREGDAGAAPSSPR